MEPHQHSALSLHMLLRGILRRHVRGGRRHRQGPAHAADGRASARRIGHVCGDDHVHERGGDDDVHRIRYAYLGLRLVPLRRGTGRHRGGSVRRQLFGGQIQARVPRVSVDWCCGGHLHSSDGCSKCF